MMRRLTVLFAACALTAAAETLRVENDHLALAVDTAGGRITSIRPAAAPRELTSGDGLLSDNFWNVGESRFFLKDKPYDAEFQSPASLRLTAHHRGGGIDFMEVAKTVSIPADAALFTVDYRFHNLAAAMGELRYGFWMQNFIGAAGGNRRSFFPTQRGIVAVNSREAQPEQWFTQPARGWCAFIDGDGNGLVQIADPALVKSFYQWTSQGPGSLTTQEIRLDEIPIPAGQSVSTRFEFIPFSGLSKVSGAGNGLVGAVDVTPESAPGTNLNRNVKVTLFIASAQRVTAVRYCRALPAGGAVQVYSREIVFARPADRSEFSFAYQLPTWPTLYDIDVRIFAEDGSPLAMLNAPTSAQASMLNYRLEPAAERAYGEIIVETDLTDFDNSLETPHIPWAKPLAGGPVRLLALTQFSSYRELAELAQRLDVELHSTVWTLPYKNLFTTGKYYGTLTDADVLDSLDQLLAEEYDVIMMGGVSWQHLRPAQREEILRKVRAGAGLVEVGVAAPEEMLPGLSALHVTDVANGVPARARSGYLGDAIPFELVPHYLIAKAAANETSWAESGANCWLASREVGSGRSVGIGWYSGGGNGRMMPGLTPEIAYPNPGKVNPGFWEIHQLVMAKAVVYAARREPGFGFGPVQIEAGNGGFDLDLTFTGTTPAEPMRLRFFVRDRENREKTRIELPAAPDAGLRQRVRVPATPFAGRQLIGMQLVDAAGEIVDFGAVSAEYAPPAAFKAVEAERRVWSEGETARYSVSVTNPAAADAIAWEWRDAYGRLLAAGQTAPQAELVIAVPVADAMAMRGYTLTAGLYAGGHEVDRAVRPVAARPAPEKLVRTNFEAGIWLTPRASDAIRPYLHELLAAKLREMRMETMIANNTGLDIDFAVRFNFHPTRLEHAGTQAAQLPQKFIDSGDKRDLARKPCLSDPEFRAATRDRFQKLGEEYADLGLRFYWLGDELSLAGYWSNPIDFCFSEHCLANFRGWLLERYGSLEAINRQWGSGFASLEAVLPDTRQEARARTDGNYSAWADHLEYMDWLLCDFIADVTAEGLRRGDPAAETFISGPQEASAYGGNDWQRQPGIYTGMMSYSSGALRETALSFHPGSIDLPWVLGYDNVGPEVCYNLWQALLAGSKGVMAFHAPSLINPDYTFSASGRAIVDYLPEVVDGIGQLIAFGLERPAPEVLIVYSQPSVRAAYIAGSSGNHTNLRWKYVTLCKNFGIPYRFTSPEELAEGILDRPGAARLVVLPDIDAAGDAMLAALERHLGNGGRLLAEGNFARFDGHCRKMPADRLNAWPRLAGFVQSGAADANCDYFQAWSKPPVMRTQTDREALNDGLRRMSAACAAAGIAPAAIFRDASGAPVWDLEMARFTDSAGNPYLMVITRDEETRRLTLELPAPAHIYESHRRLGVDSGAPQIWEIAADAPFFAAQPPRPDAGEPALAAEPAGEREFELTVTADTTRDTVYRLRLTAPDGGEPFWYAVNLDAPRGRGSHRLSFALDDLPGEWQVEIRDVVTGATARTTITLP